MKAIIMGVHIISYVPLVRSGVWIYHDHGGGGIRKNQPPKPSSPLPFYHPIKLGHLLSFITFWLFFINIHTSHTLHISSHLISATTTLFNIFSKLLLTTMITTLKTRKKPTSTSPINTIH